MHFLDVAKITQRYPEHQTAIEQIIEKQSQHVDSHLQAEQHYCAHSKLIRTHFCMPVYESLGCLIFGEYKMKEADLEDANARLGVNVESETQAGLIKVISALNVCKKCLASGASDEDSRNVTSRMRFIRGWDEPGIEILTCQRCGHIWKR